MNMAHAQATSAAKSNSTLCIGNLATESKQGTKGGAYAEEAGKLQKRPMADLSAPIGGKVHPLRSTCHARETEPEATKGKKAHHQGGGKNMANQLTSWVCQGKKGDQDQPR